MPKHKIDTQPKFEALDQFTQGYYEAMFFTQSGDELDGGSISDLGYYDMSPETHLQIVKDCQKFQDANQELLEYAYDESNQWNGKAKYGSYNPAQAGHDFWLTRNGHGAGYFDRGMGELGERLQNAARAYKEFDVFIGDDGTIHH